MHTTRYRNFMVLVRELRSEGAGESALPGLFGMTRAELDRIFGGGTIGDATARDLEWSMNRPAGWMDRAHPDDVD
jgi:hypothetical protein